MFKSTGITITKDEPILVYTLDYFKRLKDFVDNINIT